MLAGTTNGAGSMYIFLPAEAIDAKRRIDVAMKAGVYQQISKTSSNYIPKSMKSMRKNQSSKVMHHSFPPRDHRLFVSKQGPIVNYEQF